MHHLNDLKIWNKAMDIAEKTYLLSANFPTEEKFGLTSQIRSAAGSVPSNIAEGAGRNTKGKFKNFLCIANASFYELYTHLILLHRLEEEKVKPVSSEVFEVQKMNYALM
ncbi:MULTISPECIES: four helix bundle protein [Salegentibacter]|jgi:four helix bundle protein|uniref:Four helix bundle protein n=1 Tax=Salegentibacter agarivorans TaxID=345907 RepID=A0A1I2MRC0_9FLAO|nr:MULTISPECIES: four helix bundle protein [Salegentibacter]SFF91671.1 four helix bundle protein [Salegentibacter agarivorans]